MEFRARMPSPLISCTCSGRGLQAVAAQRCHLLPGATCRPHGPAAVACPTPQQRIRDVLAPKRRAARTRALGLVDVVVGVLHGTQATTTSSVAAGASAFAADASGFGSLLQGVVNVGSAAISSLTQLAAGNPSELQELETELQADVVQDIRAVEAAAAALPAPLERWVDLLGDDLISVALFNASTESMIRLTVSGMPAHGGHKLHGSCPQGE